MPSLDELVAQHNPAKPLSLDEALAAQSQDWHDAGAPSAVTSAPQAKPSGQSPTVGPNLRSVGNQTFGAQMSPTFGLVQAGMNYLTGGRGVNPTNAGVVHGLANDVVGPAQTVAHVAGSDVMDSAANAVQGYFDKNYNPSKSGEMVGASIPFMFGLNGAGAGSESGQVLTTAQKVKAALASWVAPTVIAPAITPETNIQGNSDYWTRKAKEGGAALATAGLLRGAYQLPQVAVNAWATKFRNPQAAQLLTDLEATNNPMKPSQIISATEPAAPEVAAIEKTVNQFKDSLKTSMDQTPFAVGELQTVANSNGPRSAAAKAILEQASQEGDPSKILSTSAGIRAVQEKIRMDQLGSAVESLSGDVSGPLTNAANAVDQRVAFLKSDLYSPGQNAAEIKALEALKARFLGTPQTDSLNLTSAGRGPVVIRNGSPVPEVRDALVSVIEPGSPASPSVSSGPQGSPSIPVPTYQNARATRSNLGQIISDLYKGKNAVTGQPDAATLQAIKNGLQQDMSEMAQNSGKPALAAADKAFQSEYSKYAGTFKDPDVVSVIQNPKPDTLMATLAKAGPNKAQKIMDVLDPKGQAAYAVGTFDQAIKGAIYPRTGGDIIPGNISTGVGKVSDALGVTITDPALKSQMDSMVNVIQALARSNPQQASALGQRITGSIVEAGDKTGLVMGALRAIKDHGVDMFFNSKAGKDFLFKAKGLAPDSPAMDALIRQDMPAILASRGARSAATVLPAAASTGQNDQVAQTEPK